jgi:hypothetical protein
MIGDSANDILVARNAGIPSIAVPFGYSDVPIETLEPGLIIAHFSELTPELVETLLGERHPDPIIISQPGITKIEGCLSRKSVLRLRQTTCLVLKFREAQR